MFNVQAMDGSQDTTAVLPEPSPTLELAVELLSCKQIEGKSLADYCARIRQAADQVNVCPGL